MIFIDSDALIGISVPQDAHNLKAVQLFAILAKRNEKLATSWESIDEVSTKLSMFFGKDISRKFSSFLVGSNIEIVFIDKFLSTQTIEIFNQQTSKNVSLTDCANIAICRSLGITHIFSFDTHYKQNGLTLL